MSQLIPQRKNTILIPAERAKTADFDFTRTVLKDAIMHKKIRAIPSCDVCTDVIVYTIYIAARLTWDRRSAYVAVFYWKDTSGSVIIALVEG